MNERRYTMMVRRWLAAFAWLFMTCFFCSASSAQTEELADELKEYPYKLVYETYRESNWELFIVDADGSNPVNLTRTPDVNEIYPKVSPDGTKIAFLVDEGQGVSLVRSAYWMNLDGTGRKLIGKHIRWLFWSPDGTRVAYLKEKPGEFDYRDDTSKGLVLYDPTTAKHEEHPNKDLHHIYNVGWSPDGNWFVATVHAGMGYRHTNLAIEARGTKVFDLGFGGCRPDISPDGKRVAWGASDWTIRAADLDLTGSEPKITNSRDVVNSPKPNMVYHTDWSPDGKYIAFSRGARTKRLGISPAYVGIQGEGWNICVADPTQENRWVAITTDGKSNKEPEWVRQRVAP